MHAKVYLFARRHGPPGLSFYAATRLLLALDPYRDSPPETPPLVRDGILDAIKCVFTTIPEDDANPDPVRNILLKFLTSNHAHLRPLFQILANRYPQIMVTLVNHMSELLAVFQGDETVFCRRRRTVKTAFGLSHSQRKLMYMAMEVGLLELSSKHLCEIVDQASTRLGITLVEINGLMIKAFGECFDG